MELLLNLVWLGIAGAGMVWHLRSGSKDGRQFLLALAALACILLLLFPAISISDDLSAMAFVAEDSTPGKRLASEAAHVVPLGQLGSLVLLAVLLLAGLTRTLWFVGSARDIRSSLTEFHRPVVGRAPPVLSLA